MQFRILTRQGSVNACALARCANCINSVVVVIADLGHKLRLQNASVAHCEARRQSISIDHGHLEGVHASSVQRDGICRIAAHTCRCTLACRNHTRCSICVAYISRCGAALLRCRRLCLQVLDACFQCFYGTLDLFFGRCFIVQHNLCVAQCLLHRCHALCCVLAGVHCLCFSNQVFQSVLVRNHTQCCNRIEQCFSLLVHCLLGCIVIFQ